MSVLRLVDAIDLEALRSQPRTDRLDVGVGDSILCAELLGCKPFTVLRRVWVLKRTEQLPQCNLLPMAPSQHQLHAVSR